MNISSRCEYACRAAVELGYHASSDEPLTAQTIAERRAVPEKYLVHILLQLKRAGLVRSVRGAQGGYLLAKSPEDITLLDVVTAVDGPILEPLPVDGEGSQELSHAWKSVRKGVESVLSKVTLQAILDRADTGNMYYI